ncbi:MAG: SpaA isopeptide-forming pilin-related protein, partial [Candidatus Aenigmarchaeota archaeon]|nr:SpaA isopeptide-forming pilin-related protein [Candidatus Aenigmarchaeota archaeon]
VEPCTTIQIDVVDANGVGRDWIVWVSNKQSPADCNVCPYQSTEARLHTEEDGTLRKHLEVYLGTKVKAVGTHNQQAIYWSDTLLTITGPNNFVFNCQSQCWFTPPYVGVYTLKVTTKGYSGPNCEDTATLVVKPIPPTTTIGYGSLKIFKFDDRNGNGIWESGEKGLPGFRFNIEGPVSKTVYTNADGYALESNLPYGVYKITETVPEGWEVTTLNPQYVTINSPELKEVKFGNRQIPVSTPPCTTTTVCHQPCYEPEDISVGSVEISPYTICREKDTSIEISVPVRLAAGKDNTEVTARFYVKEDGRYIYIGKTTHILDVGEKRTFTLQYDYNAYDLSYGTHDVKIVVEGRKDSETRYSAIRVVRCLEPKDIEVGFIYLNPENPRSSDLVEGRVPITLKEAPSLPQNVYVEVRIDGKVLTESSLRFYHIETKDYKFYFNADKYGQGTHTIEVTAWVDGISDTSMRRFIIDETSYFRTTPEHCLIIKDFWTDNPLKEGESAVIKIRVRNCGMHVETNIQSRLYILNKTVSGGIISLRPNEERDIAFTIRVPEDIDGVKAKVNVWNSYASDEVEKEFAVKMGYPYVKSEKDYRVMQCQQNNISFIVKNVGQVKDTFTLTIEGEPAKWMSGYPRMIELEPEETKKIYVDVNVPCDAKGVYQFTITARGSPKYSVTSNLIVAKRPFEGLSALSDLLWVILLLLLLLFILFLLMSMKRRNKKPERCMGPHGC